MDLASIEQKLVAGEALKVKYRYPVDGAGKTGVRTDKLLDVSVELSRLYTKFCGESPIWVEQDEVVEIEPDDGIYEDF